MNDTKIIAELKLITKDTGIRIIKESGIVTLQIEQDYGQTCAWEDVAQMDATLRNICELMLTMSEIIKANCEIGIYEYALEGEEE